MYDPFAGFPSIPSSLSNTFAWSISFSAVCLAVTAAAAVR